MTTMKTRAGRAKSHHHAPPRSRRAAAPDGAEAAAAAMLRESRIIEIAGWIACDGLSPEDVHAFMQSPECEWPAPRPAKSSLDSWIAEAIDIIGLNPVRTLDQEIGVSLRRLNDLYHRARRIQDYKTALAVEKARQELLGLRGQIDFNAPNPDTNQEEEEGAAAPASRRT